MSELTAEQQAEQGEYLERVRAFAQGKGVVFDQILMLDMVALGKSYTAISEAFGITKYAAKKRVRGIKERLGFNDNMPQYLLLAWLSVKFGSDTPNQKVVGQLEEVIKFKEAYIA